jgi:hypothetical protein
MDLVIRRRARALGYDHWETLGSTANFQDLVAFLEHRVIRNYKVGLSFVSSSLVARVVASTDTHSIAHGEYE